MDPRVIFAEANPTELESAIYATLRYYSLFDQPLTATQLWRSLILPTAKTSTRWDSHRIPQLQEIEKVLTSSLWLLQKIGSTWGYYYLKGQELSVQRWLHRHVLAQQKWKLARRLARYLAFVPFIQTIAIGGSLAQGNARPESDLDLFMITTKRRVWMARLGAVAMAQLTGHRRKHWHRLAPDKLCLNHYITADALAVSSDIRNIFTAVLYRNLILLYGLSTFNRFQQSNASWQKRFIMFPDSLTLPSAHMIGLPGWLSTIKNVIERFLAEPLMDGVEKMAEIIQRSIILRHMQPAQGGRIVMSATELAFHPNSKVSAIVEKFKQDEGQKTLI